MVVSDEMDPWERLRDFLDTDPRDAGCDLTFALIHAYAEIVVNGEDPENELPGITSHLSHCPPCEEDLRGLLRAMRAVADAR